MAELTEYPAEDDGLRTAAAALLTAFENLGPEHQALTAEGNGATAKERQGTVRRMTQSLVNASRTLVHAMELLTQSYGMRALGIGNQMSKDADGADYSPLLTSGNPDEKLYETASFVQVAVRRVGEAYEPTKKYPGLATARQPQAVRTVLVSLRTALNGLCAEMMARDLTEDSAEFAPCLTFLEELEARVCTTLPTLADLPGCKHVTWDTTLYGKLLSAGIGSAERDVIFWLLCQPTAQEQQPLDEIATQLHLESDQVDEALKKLRAIGLLRADGTLVSVYNGPAPA
ncbi:hypothetical protein [Streptomyces candidus]|uniref:Uncharacterized protein n=1 Tax=Streptomyces candidus TaxID=67283 RepID=A0A7X0LTM5_9ACTN|nr:hypothetical protein [Streptomyces candidus]MBB6439574.1 hypothetical protein [Streptomyces candidus]